MIAAHDKMLAGELKEAVAQNDSTEDIADPEKMALKELVPGQAEVAQSSPALDPLGLDNLPDVNNLMPAQPSPLVEPPTPTPATYAARNDNTACKPAGRADDAR